MEYTFTDTDKIYAVPIECIYTEKGGKNPFGEWMPSTENHWAYVLVQYDDSLSSYTYGFTFKDSAGYGLYPITLTKLDEDGEQIKTNLEISKLNNGIFSNLMDKEKWENSGFNLKESSKIQVYEMNENGICRAQPKCKVTNGSGKSVGDEIKCSDEIFYIVENTESTTTMLSKYGLDLTTTSQKYNSSSLNFSETNYWKENDDYPKYVYNSNSNFYQYVEKYEEYLQNDVGVLSANAKLISYEQLINLGCDEQKGTCKDSPYISWLKTAFHWCSGSTGGKTGIWTVYSTSAFYSGSYAATNLKVRPIIIISNEEINYNN